MKNLFDKTTGHVKTAPKQGDAPEKKKDVEAINKVKEICLNCERPTCKGCASKKEQFVVRRRSSGKDGGQ